MMVEAAFSFKDWIEDFDKAKVELFRALLGEIDTTFYDLIMFRTPEDDHSKKGKQKAPREHIKMNWEHSIDERALTANFRNPVPYGRILDLGLYPNVGPWTVASGDGIYSKMAPHGIIQPLLKDTKLLSAIVKTIADKVVAKAGAFRR